MKPQYFIIPCYPLLLTMNKVVEDCFPEINSSSSGFLLFIVEKDEALLCDK